MMRLTWATIVALLITAPTFAQQSNQNRAAQAQPAARVAGQIQNVAPRLPFPPLSAAEQARLQQFLISWERHSEGTKTLDSKFTRWHFDGFAAPAGVHATRADGVLKYAAPDKGLFKVERLINFAGMQDGKPQFKEQPGQYGEHWVCNGQQLIEFDREKEQCRIQELPLEMQGQQIFNSPLPFVFNLNAAQIQQRYWIRLVNTGQEGVVLVEAFPKRQEDRAQYKLVQIALDDKTFLPQALILYAPNFDKKTAPKWDHYEFTDTRRNAIGAGFQKFLGNFIPQKPPGSWKILREKFVPPMPGDNQTPNPQTPDARRADAAGTPRR